MNRNKTLLPSLFYAILFCFLVGDVLTTSLQAQQQNGFPLQATQNIPSEEEAYEDELDDDSEEIDDEEGTEEEPVISQEMPAATARIIKDIVIQGNAYLSQNAIRAKIPYHIGERFDISQTNTLIHNIYDLGYVESVVLEGEEISTDEIVLYITVQEKMKVESFAYVGNTHLTADEIEKKIALSKVPALNQEELVYYADRIKTLYQEKNYQSVAINATLEPTPNGAYIATFTIIEGSPTLVKRVLFKGNNLISSKKLRTMIFTREDWILGFLDQAGSYQKNMLEQDKQRIEYIYQSNGFFTARVVDVLIDADPLNPCALTVTFVIDEGECYVIKSVSAPGNDIFSEMQLLNAIPIRPGQLYSRESIGKCIEIMSSIWGQYGYIYSDVNPNIVPDFENKTIDITFESDLGSKMLLDRLNIVGNEKTRDYVIRRMVDLNEGDVVTTPAMDKSKADVESLGYFDARDGVNWKINKLSEEYVDLDLMLKEVKTGKIYGQVGYGGSDRDIQSPNTSTKVSFGVGDTNAFGTGIAYNINLTWSQQDRSAVFNIGSNWLFDRPITVGLQGYHRKSTYEDFKNLANVPVETTTGATGILGFAPLDYRYTRILINTGFERISFASPVRLAGEFLDRSEEQQRLLERLFLGQFQNGNFHWVGTSIGQDLRNNPLHPNRGYQWTLTTKTGIPSTLCRYGFAKLEGDATWFTPVINDYDLIFLLHGHLGYVRSIKDGVIPYRELFHLGGPATVRGFYFGQIGPMINGDSIGGTKAFWVNAELIFNVTRDFSIRGVLFYDGGAGWDAFDIAGINDVRNNRFQFRHSIGFGIRMTQPTPVKIDWGFKLDRRKRLGETIGEVHFTMSQDF